MTKSGKKVCIVGISLGKGGAERSMAMLSEMLVNKGHDVHIVILEDNIAYPYKGKLFNLGSFKTKNDTFFKRCVRFLKLRNYLLKHKFDFIIDHRPKNDYQREVFYSRYIYKKFRKIYVVHSSEQPLNTEKNADKFREIFYKNFTTVAVSNYIETEILQKNSITNTLTIHNAFNPDWTHDAELPHELKNKNYILSYGRMVDNIKDITFLINAFNLSNLWKKNVYLVLLGDGEDKQQLQQYSQTLECSGFIRFFPFTPSPFPYISGSKFVTLTSKYEGFPMVLVEALSLQVPVVSLDIHSGPNEIIKHESNGLLVKERNEKVFAQAMISMFENIDLYNHCKKNAFQSVKQFSEDVTADKWNKLLSK